MKEEVQQQQTSESRSSERGTAEEPLRACSHSSSKRQSKARMTLSSGGDSREVNRSSESPRKERKFRSKSAASSGESDDA